MCCIELYHYLAIAVNPPPPPQKKKKKKSVLANWVRSCVIMPVLYPVPLVDCIGFVRKKNQCYSVVNIHCCESMEMKFLTHWGRVTDICVSKLTIIGSDNCLSPGRCQAIIRTNAGMLLIGPCGTKFHEILIESQIFSFKKMHFKMASAKWRPFSLGLNVLITCPHRWRCATVSRFPYS